MSDKKIRETVGESFAKYWNKFEQNTLPEALEEIKEDGRKQALVAALKNTNALPRVVAQSSPSRYFFPYFLGTVKKSFIFFNNGSFLSSPVTKSIPLCSSSGKLMTEELASEFIKAVDTTLSSGLPITQIPSGFFVFQYQAQWTAGGYEDEQKTVFTVRKAKSLEKATQDLIRLELGGQHENCFWDFSVNSGGVWRRLYGRPYSTLYSRLTLLESTLSLEPY